MDQWTPLLFENLLSWKFEEKSPNGKSSWSTSVKAQLYWTLDPSPSEEMQKTPEMHFITHLWWLVIVHFSYNNNEFSLKWGNPPISNYYCIWLWKSMFFKIFPTFLQDVPQNIFNISCVHISKKYLFDLHPLRADAKSRGQLESLLGNAVYLKANHVWAFSNPLRNLRK